MVEQSTVVMFSPLQEFGLRCNNFLHYSCFLFLFLFFGSLQGIVPHFITCNAFIGRSYAHVLNGFLRDCMRGKSCMALDPTEPLYIIELGTGSGKFSFFMLKALLEMKARTAR